MSDPFIGQIMAVGFNFAPRGWATCDGQLLSIATNTALFSLIGTYYGGNGTSTFALPDLRGRVAIHQNSGGASGLTPRNLGERSGTESVTLSIANMPQHTHSLTASSATPTTADPTGAQLPVGSSRIYAAAGSPGASLAANSIGVAGSAVPLPIPIMQPYLVVNWIIALQGVFPTRS